MTEDLTLPLAPDVIESLVKGRHGDPFSILGPHPSGDRVTIRTLQPAAKAVSLIMASGRAHPMEKRHQDGFFTIDLPEGEYEEAYKLRLTDADDQSIVIEDPYRFPSKLGEMDQYLMAEGTHAAIYEKLGAHPSQVEGIKGIQFAVWAPNAKRVSVVGDFNQWDERRHPMRFHPGPGVWELFLPSLEVGTHYKYEILSHHSGYRVMKADPVGFFSQLRPDTASIVWDLDQYQWNDEAYMKQRRTRQHFNEPLSIYEVHLGSWRRKGESGEEWLSYEELIEILIPYAVEMQFTHLELLPIAEHPYDGSWGYQVTGFFSPTSRFGTPDGFMAFIDACHQAGLGVILDWVPAHFPTDEHGLGYFDGTHLFEHADPRQGFHPDWGTYIFNFGRNEVRQFLISNALFWLEKYHIDGLRVDAVASMLYLDFSRGPGEWVANRYGGRENLEAISFLRAFNRAVHERFPGVLTMAEESTSWPGVTASPEEDGLGFDYKWNMGWMHDTLKYMSNDPVYRSHHQGALTFSLLYAFSEKFLLPLSHDEVVHLKRSLLDKMPGDTWQKFANLRALLAYMWAHPGKKLLFMGGEFGQWREWSESRSLDWHLVEQFDSHRGVQKLVVRLNELYLRFPALHALDHSWEGFQWIDFHDAEASVLVFLRQDSSASDRLIVVCNFTPIVRHRYPIGVPESGVYREVLNTDAHEFGGSGVANPPCATEERPWHRQPASIRITLPPLAVVFLQQVTE